MSREPPERGLAGGTQRDDDLPSIVPMASPLDHAAFLETVDELDHRVVADLQSLGQGADRRGLTPRQSLHLEEDEVLLGLHARPAGAELADAQESPDSIAQVGEGLVIDGAAVVAAAGHRSRYDGEHRPSRISRHDTIARHRGQTVSEALVILAVLLVWIAILTAIAIVRRLARGGPSAAEVEFEELRARRARGEIAYEEYDRRRHALREGAPTTGPPGRGDPSGPPVGPARP